VLPAQHGVIFESIADVRQAEAWLHAERRVLLAAITLAEQTGFRAHAWRIGYILDQASAPRGRHGQGACRPALRTPPRRAWAGYMGQRMYPAMASPCSAWLRWSVPLSAK
jgi:hypothetical protein